MNSRGVVHKFLAGTVEFYWIKAEFKIFRQKKKLMQNYPNVPTHGSSENWGPT